MRNQGNQGSIWLKAYHEGFNAGLQVGGIAQPTAARTIKRGGRKSIAHPAASPAPPAVGTAQVQQPAKRKTKRKTTAKRAKSVQLQPGMAGTSA